MRRFLLACCAVLTLNACGGGGGGSAAPSTPPPSTSPSPVQIGTASVLWQSAANLLWPNAPAGSTYTLYFAANGGMSANSSGVQGADGSVALTAGSNGQLSLAASEAANAKARLKGQVLVARFNAAGTLAEAHQVQIQGVLDDLYAQAAAPLALGPSFDAQGVATLRVWAPTAKSVKLNVFVGAASQTVNMVEDAASGTWSYTAPDASWTNTAYYTYSVNVYSRWANAVVTNEVSDPYAVSLNANGARSFLADLSSAAAKPAGWDAQAIPALASPLDIAIYELHVRDFSATDASVPAAHRSKYLAFTDSASNGMLHLQALQRSGLTHIHLLPTHDMSTVNEAGCVTPAIPDAAADSDQQQAAVTAAKDTDCFNWGYDPEHFNAPEGSYATDAADGLVRIREYRAMVQALHAAGLRVAMDVVYNHTSSAKQNDHSVLDKIVPGYYYRLNADGEILTDSCCSDTAPENAMMGKLVVDSTSLWVKQYAVDSFRFDIMGMLPLALIQQVQSAANSAAGRDIYLYGEAWNFGAVANDARFKQARQSNLAGTGIGAFNDRIRDAVRGGGCCDSGAALFSQQGFINGVFYDRNASSVQNQDDLLRLSDLVRVSLSASLRDYSFTDRFGNVRTNSQIDYFGQQAGFTGGPSETINYIEAHDNQTLFDVDAYKLPQATTAAERARVQNLGNAIVLLAQGIPFIHAGQDILRSKSLDRDTYNAGDWFNAIDWTYQSNRFGIGLPVANVNGDMWSLMKPVLTNPAIKPAPADIASARDVFRDFLAIRKDSTLFRLRTAQDIKDRLSFLNTGPGQVPGVVALRIDGTNYAGAKYKSVAVFFNVTTSAKTLNLPELAGKTLRLHPIQAAGADARVKQAAFANGSVDLPARTVAVFVE